MATETARHLAAKPSGALQASKRLLKRSFRELTKAAMAAENEVFSVQVRSDEAKAALAAFIEKHSPAAGSSQQISDRRVARPRSEPIAGMPGNRSASRPDT